MKKPRVQDTTQINRFVEAARALECDEDESAFKAKPAVIARQKPKVSDSSTDPVGWYVRVKTDKVYDGVYNTVLYIAGFPTPAEAKKAVRIARSTPGERYEVLPREITADRGPQPKPGEVRLIEGAV